MKISAIKSSQDNISSKQPSLDNHENELRKQITDLQEEKKNISNDKEKTSEEKKKEKQAVQEEIQALSSELRQYQIQKRQEEAAKKQEALKEAAEDARSKGSEKEPGAAVFGDEKSGVLISLSATKGQISDMKRIRTELERRQRTAASDEEKTDLQKRVNKVSGNIGRKVTITEDNMANFRNSGKKGNETKQVRDQAFDWKSEIASVNTAEDTEEVYSGNLIENRKKFFDTVSIFLR